jgi:hypothetical protein
MEKQTYWEQTKDIIGGCGIIALAGALLIVDRTYYNLLHLYFHAAKTEHWRYRSPYTGFREYERGPKELSDKF